MGEISFQEGIDRIVKEANKISNERLQQLDKAGYFDDYLNR